MYVWFSGWEGTLVNPMSVREWSSEWLRENEWMNECIYIIFRSKRAAVATDVHKWWHPKFARYSWKQLFRKFKAKESRMHRTVFIALESVIGRQNGSHPSLYAQAPALSINFAARARFHGSWTLFHDSAPDIEANSFWSAVTDLDLFFHNKMSERKGRARCSLHPLAVGSFQRLTPPERWRGATHPVYQVYRQAETHCT